MAKVEIVPAILVKDALSFASRIKSVEPHVNRVQIDIMDGKFVPNVTLQPEDFTPIPKNLEVEYHLMVEHPLDYVRRIGKKDAIYELHIESFSKASGRGGEGKIKGKELEKQVLSAIAEIKKMGGKAALVLSPDTPPEIALPYLGKVEHVLVMTVYPGFSGQSYLPAMEKKMRWLHRHGFVVEVDGGVDIGSAKTSAAAGATLLGVASGIFAKPDLAAAIEQLKKDAEAP